MQRMLTRTLIPLLVTLMLGACEKESPKAPEAPKETPKAEVVTPKAPTKAAEQPEAKADKVASGTQGSVNATKPSIDTKTEVAKEPAAGEGVESDVKAKLAKVYTEIYCAQRRGESEKLLDIYTKNGFDNPETWTKVWTKAAEDGAWVAKITHDAIRTCGDQAPPTVDPSAP